MEVYTADFLEVLVMTFGRALLLSSLLLLAQESHRRLLPPIPILPVPVAKRTIDVEKLKLKAKQAGVQPKALIAPSM